MSHTTFVNVSGSLARIYLTDAGLLGAAPNPVRHACRDPYRHIYEILTWTWIFLEVYFTYLFIKFVGWPSYYKVFLWESLLSIERKRALFWMEY